ncbi:MAG: hypothetical protein VR72_17860 [Clostridiaceae bacterium BRH_c20a]|nr:MAG: hypothetical protein VR72_17860 [Clostridiaceae bacterium BRH_c20a]
MKSFKPWYIINKERFQREVELLAKSEFNFVLDQVQKEDYQRIVFNGEIEVKGEKYPLKIVYPPSFPFFRIDIISPKTSFHRHQNWKSKNLCLLPHGQDGWEQDTTGLDMVYQAKNLIEDSLEGPQIIAEKEVDAPEPWSTYLSFSELNLLIPDGLPNTIPTGSYGEFRVRIINNNTLFLDFMVNEQPIHKEYYQFREIPIFLESIAKQRQIKGIWVKVSTIPPSQDIKGMLSWLIKQVPESQPKLLKSFSLKKSKDNFELLSIIFPEENNTRGNFKDSWLTGFIKNNNIIRPHYLDPTLWFERNPSLKNLMKKKVMVLGLGSLGSSIALELSKAGIGSLFIVDRDTVEIGNLVRHVANINYLGRTKVEAVARIVSQQNPFIQVEGMIASIGMINDYSLTKKDIMADLFQYMKSCDLILDMMADEGVTHIVNEMAVDLEIPVIHAWISNGAWGGRIIRTIPNKTGCYYCLCLNGVEEISNNTSEKGIFPRGCGFPTFTGASFDIQSIVSATTRFSVQTLLEGSDYQNPEYDHIIIDNNGTPINNYPAVRTFKVERNITCPICGGNYGG